jgi:hypothetical protein
MPRTRRAFWAFVNSDHAIVMWYWRKKGELGPWAVQQEYEDKSTSPPPSIALFAWQLTALDPNSPTDIHYA